MNKITRKEFLKGAGYSVSALALSAIAPDAFATTHNLSDGDTVCVTTDNAVLSTEKDKTIFAAQMNELYTKQCLAKNGKTPSREIVDNLLLQVANATELDKIAINEELATYGVYEFAGQVIERPVTRTGTGDVDLNTPIIYYEAWSTCWSVTCGGKWNTTNYGDFYMEVGGYDAFGVGYTNCTHPYQSQVVSTSAYMSDIENKYSVKTSNRSDGDGSKGFGFRLQDAWQHWTIGYYVGQNWSGVCTYDKYFSSYNGVATAYYIHTWDQANLSRLDFGVEGMPAGIHPIVTIEEQSFVAFSDDKSFGVYP